MVCLLVSELRRFQNARFNDKKVSHMFSETSERTKYATRCKNPKDYHRCNNRHYENFEMCIKFSWRLRFGCRSCETTDIRVSVTS